MYRGIKTSATTAAVALNVMFVILLYWTLIDPDPLMRRAQRQQMCIRWYRSVAEYCGHQVIRYENEYNDIMRSIRGDA